ncbi:carboxypeptidase O-like isoform X2 [Phyllobates terribilis]|uniref:carboxypeptidase O-like isoform X2 n=1 Tax=Phyllobates terribilis TaxID=111132 RepID=UPI003CCA786C
MEVVHYIMVIFYSIAFQTLATQVQYNGDQVLSIVPETPSHAVYIEEICNDVQLDLWKPSHVEEIYPGREVHVRVPSSRLYETKRILHQKKISFSVLIDDVQKLIQKQFVVEHRQKRSLTSFDYTKYHPMNEIYEWMDQIKETHKDLVALHYLGSTYETRPIYYFKIGLPSAVKKKIIWMDCGIHAREWISVAFCQWFIKEILNQQSSNHVIHKALKNIDFYIVPVLNIDGFLYSWNTAVLTFLMCCNWFPGSLAGKLSEPGGVVCLCKSSQRIEQTAEREELGGARRTGFGENLAHHITMEVAMGWISTEILIQNGALSVGKMAAIKIAETHGAQYKYGSASQILYNNSGSSRDWATDLGIPFTYTFELRDNGTYGFILPEALIQPTCEEATAGILSIINYLNEKHFNSASSISPGTLWINLSFSIVIGAYYSLY